MVSGATFDHKVTFSPKRSCAVILIGMAIIAIVAWQLAQPIKSAVADRFLKRGDTYFAQLQFDNAAREYGKALGYNEDLQEAVVRKELAEEAATDIAAARDLLDQLGNQAAVIKIDTAQALFSSPKEALQAGVDFYSANEYSFARYPLEQATQLDPAYPEAWHYLSLTYEKLAGENAEYRSKAEDARKKRDSLTANYLQP